MNCKHLQSVQLTKSRLTLVLVTLLDVGRPVLTLGGTVSWAGKSGQALGVPETPANRNLENSDKLTGGFFVLYKRVIACTELC